MKLRAGWTTSLLPPDLCYEAQELVMAKTLIHVFCPDTHFHELQELTVFEIALLETCCPLQTFLGQGTGRQDCRSLIFCRRQILRGHCRFDLNREGNSAVSWP